MSLNGLLNQTITVYAAAGYDKTGRVTDGAAVEYPARVQETTKQKLLPNSELITVELICYVANTVTVEVNDRVDWNSKKFKVIGKYAAVDGTGTTNHYKLECVKWRET